MALRSLNYISLCTGGGGLDLGFELALHDGNSERARPVCYVEREAFCASHLVAAIESGLMADAPLWSDVVTFNGRPWRGAVDFVIGGIPCQPHSQAGKRKGKDDERDLWADARRIIIQSGAWGVVIENVEGMLSSGGAERVVRDLERLGFLVKIGLFTASEVGCTHRRARVFILGIMADTGGARSQRLGTDAGAVGRQDAGRLSGLRGGTTLGDTTCELHDGRQHGGQGRRREHPDYGDDVADPDEPVLRRDEPAGQFAIDEQDAGNGRRALADASRGRCDGRPERRAFTEWTGVGLQPPRPNERDAWARIIADAPHLAPALSSIDGAEIAGLQAIAAMGAAGASPEAESEFRRMADDVAARLDIDRIDRLRMLGNGVDPLEAAYALRTLGARLAADGCPAAAEFFMTDSAAKAA